MRLRPVPLRTPCQAVRTPCEPESTHLGIQSSGGTTLYSLTLVHAFIPGTDLSNGLGVTDETEPVALSKYRVTLRNENSEAAVYQRDKAPLWQVELTQRTADEDG